MNSAKIILIVVVALIAGGSLGFYGRSYLPSRDSSENSLAQFVMNNPTPWRADVQGVVSALGEDAISFQLRTEEGTSKKIYTISLAPKENFVIEKVEIASDSTVTSTKANYEDLKVGDEVMLTISSDGQNESLTISSITLISSGAPSQ